MTSPVLMPAGHAIVAADLDAYENLTGVWTPYVPPWTASAGTPAIGNGILSGRFNQVGKTLDWQVKLIGGSTTTYGTAGASWNFGMPNGLLAADDQSFAVFFEDSGVNFYNASGYIGSGVNICQIGRPGGTGLFFNNNPFTFGTGDILRFSARTEVT